MAVENKRERVPKRVLSALVSSVAAGVVPRVGAPYIAIGRADELEALLSDLETISEGGSAMRFIIGRYGSGKSFLMQLLRGYACERGFVTADADLSPERRICGGAGTGIATYRELIKNLACKTSPDGKGCRTPRRRCAAGNNRALAFRCSERARCGRLCIRQRGFLGGDVA